MITSQYLYVTLFFQLLFLLCILYMCLHVYSCMQLSVSVWDCDCESKAEIPLRACGSVCVCGRESVIFFFCRSLRIFSLPLALHWLSRDYNNILLHKQRVILRQLSSNSNPSNGIGALNSFSRVDLEAHDTGSCGQWSVSGTVSLTQQLLSSHQ